MMIPLNLMITSSVFFAQAISSQEEAQHFVASIGKEAIVVLTNKELEQKDKEKQFEKLFYKSFDVKSIGKFVLGRYWRMATAEEKEKYIPLFSQMIAKTYAIRFKNYQGESFQVTSGRANTDQSYTILSHIELPQNHQKIQVDWKIADTSGGLKVLDVKVEGVSMSVTQRSEFASVIERNGGTVAGLLTELEKKVSD